MIIIYNITNQTKSETHMPPANTSQPCRHVELVRSQVAEVAMCPDCNVVHITLQHVTVRLTADAFQELVWNLSQAQSVMDAKLVVDRQANGSKKSSQEASTLDRVLANFITPKADKFH